MGKPNFPQKTPVQDGKKQNPTIPLKNPNFPSKPISNANLASNQERKMHNSTFPPGMKSRNANFPLKPNLNKSLGSIQGVKNQDSIADVFNRHTLTTYP